MDLLANVEKKNTSLSLLEVSVWLQFWLQATNWERPKANSLI